MARKRPADKSFSIRKKSKPLGPPIPVAKEDHHEELDISENELDFIVKHTKDLEFLNQLEDDQGRVTRKNASTAKGKVKKAVSVRPVAVNDDSDECDEELESYERQPRGQQSHSEQEIEAPDRVLSLPIKTPTGEVIYQRDDHERMLAATSAQNLTGEVEGIIVEEDTARKDEHKQEQLLSEEEEETEFEVANEMKEIGDEELDMSPGNIKSMGKGQSVEKMRFELKEQMARSATNVIKNPEENISHLKTMLAMLRENDNQIRCLAMLSLLAVFRDICPGYRIRLPTEKEKSMKVSKDVARIQAYEAFLLKCYQIYLKQLLEMKTTHTDNPCRKVAIRCMAGLLYSLHHFNYCSDILQAVVPEMDSKDLEIQSCACEAIAKMIENDMEGKVSLEAVQLVADLVKTKDCRCPPKVLTSLTGLQLQNINLAKDEDPTVISNKKKKKLRKADRVDKSFQAAKSAPDVEEKASVQSQTVEALFEIFFRVLKNCAKMTRSSGKGSLGGPSSEEIQERCPLLFESLKGLAQFAHVLSVEYFQDLLEVFNVILSSPSLPLLERLCCLATAADILQGEGEALNIDNKDYYQQLYWTLKHWWPRTCTPGGSTDDEDEGETLKEKQSNQDKGSTEELEVLLVKVTNQMLCESKVRDYPRLGAFVKRMMSLGLHQDTSTQMGLLAVSNRLLLRHHRLRSLLDGEGGAPVGGKEHNPHIDDPSEAFGLSSTLWEVNLLNKHYHPHVSQAAIDVGSIPVEMGHSAADTLSTLLSAMDGPTGVASRYSASKGTFWPLPKPPGKLSKARKRKLGISETTEFTEIVDDSGEPLVDHTSVLEEGLTRFYRESRRYLKNCKIRKDLRIVKAKLKAFEEHLHSNLEKGK